jgi:ABC-type uncharacterized transport system ATPase component
MDKQTNESGIVVNYGDGTKVFLTKEEQLAMWEWLAKTYGMPKIADQKISKEMREELEKLSKEFAELSKEVP